jgi:hypothetical protein
MIVNKRIDLDPSARLISRSLRAGPFDSPNFALAQGWRPIRAHQGGQITMADRWAELIPLWRDL